MSSYHTNMGQTAFTIGGGTPTSVTVGASPFSYTNPLPRPVIVSIVGGAVNDLTLNGQTLAPTLSTPVTAMFVIVMRPNDTLIITYTTIPYLYMWEI